MFVLSDQTLVRGPNMVPALGSLALSLLHLEYFFFQIYFLLSAYILLFIVYFIDF